MPTRCLPSEPNLEQLRNLAKTLQRWVREREPGAVALVREFHPRLSTVDAGSPELARFSLADMQLALARSYGFPSWPKLKAHVEIVSRYTRNPHRQPVGEPIANDAELIDEFLRLACLTYGADDPARPERARTLLAEQPQLATATIHTIAAVGHVTAARHLLAADPAQARSEGGPHRWPPLLYLAYSRIHDTSSDHSTPEVARLLLEAGADPNAGYLWEAEYPFTALTGVLGEGESGPHRQPRHRHWLELAKILLEAGADPNDSQALYNRQWSPDDSHLQLLLDHGLGRGTGTVWHTRLGLTSPTPQQLVEEELRGAAGGGRISRVRLLLPHVHNLNGIGTNHPLREGRTAHQLAVLHGNPEVADLLAGAGATPVALSLSEELRAACMRADRPAANQLRAHHPQLVHQLVDEQPNLISTAAGMGRVEAVRLMVELGFDLNPTDRSTPLHEAAFHGHLDVVRALIDAGADPTTRDPDHDSTPLGWAQYAQQHHIARYLAPLTP